MGERVTGCLREIVGRAGAGATVLVGIHGLAAMSGALSFLGVPHRLWSQFASPTNCHWIDLRRGPGGGWRIHAWNAGPDGFVDGEQQVRSAEQQAHHLSS